METFHKFIATQKLIKKIVQKVLEQPSIDEMV